MSRKLMYWIATVWLAVAMLASGIQQIFTMPGFVEILENLGYPSYFWVIMGISKVLAVIALLLPGYLLVKEWAYAGLFFAMSGAVASHIAAGDPFVEALPPLFLLALTVASWYLRPAHRKLPNINS